MSVRCPARGVGSVVDGARRRGAWRVGVASTAPAKVGRSPPPKRTVSVAKSPNREREHDGRDRHDRRARWRRCLFDGRRARRLTAASSPSRDRSSEGRRDRGGGEHRMVTGTRARHTAASRRVRSLASVAMTTHDRPFGRLLRGLRARRRLPALAGQDDHRGRRPPLLHDHDEPPSAAHRRVVRGDADAVRQERRGRQPRLLARARHERPRRERRRDRQPRGRGAPAQAPDVPRRHDLRGDEGAREARVAEPSRPRRRHGRDARASTSAAKRSATSGAR